MIIISQIHNGVVGGWISFSSVFSVFSVAKKPGGFHERIQGVFHFRPAAVCA